LCHREVEDKTVNKKRDKKRFVKDKTRSPFPTKKTGSVSTELVTNHALSQTLNDNHLPGGNKRNKSFREHLMVRSNPLTGGKHTIMGIWGGCLAVAEKELVTDGGGVGKRNHGKEEGHKNRNLTRKAVNKS